MSSSPKSPHPLVALGLCAAAGLLVVLPTAWTNALRGPLRDTAAPGARLCRAVGDTLHRWREAWIDEAGHRTRIAELEAQFARAERRRRAVELQLAEARGPEDGRSVGAPLVVPELLEARVLGTEAESEWRAGRIAGAGHVDGVREDAAVLAAEGPLVDRGRDDALESGQPVLDGRIVIGRIRTVGRWTSVVQPITSPDFRTQARLAHRSGDRLVFGATGILRGTGAKTARLSFVDSTEPVEVGDAVYTPRESDGLTEIGPLLLGKVVRAELLPGAPHWEIEVGVAAPESPERVAVLRRRFNPQRRLAD